MPFLVKSPATSATHSTPWVGETAENATLTLSAAKPGRAETITSRTLNPRTGNCLMPDKDRGQNIIESVSCCVYAAPSETFHSCVSSDDSRVNERRQAQSEWDGDLSGLRQTTMELNA